MIENSLNASNEILKNLAFLDTETTGLNPYDKSIIELSIISFDKELVRNEKTYNFEFDELKADKKALEVNRYHERKASWSNAKRFKASASEIGDLLFKKTLVAHNAFFDTLFLTQEFKRTGRGYMPWRRVIDTYSISRFLFGEEANNSLDGLRKRFSLSTEGNHTSLKDTEDLLLIYLEMSKLIKGN